MVSTVPIDDAQGGHAVAVEGDAEFGIRFPFSARITSPRGFPSLTGWGGGGEITVDLQNRGHDGKNSQAAEKFRHVPPATPLPRSMTIFIGRASSRPLTMRSM